MGQLDLGSETDRKSFFEEARENERRGIEGYSGDGLAVLVEVSGGIEGGESFREIEESWLEGEMGEGVGGGSCQRPRDEKGTTSLDL